MVSRAEDPAKVVYSREWAALRAENRFPGTIGKLARIVDLVRPASLGKNELMCALKTPISEPRTALHAESLRIPATAVGLSLLGVFAAVQSVVILRSFNGFSAVESWQTLAGIRTIEGYGIRDQYLESFAGSLVWPAISGLGYNSAGEIGPRLISLVLVCVALVASMAATRSLFGERAALWMMAGALLSAPILVVAHLSLPESLAIAGLAVSLFGTTRLIEADHRKWMILVSSALAVASIAQYRAALGIVPLTMLLLAMRGRQRSIDIALLWLSVTLAIIIHFDAFSDQIGASLSWQSILSPHQLPAEFASADTKRLLMLVWGGIPILIGAIALSRIPSRRPVIISLIAGPAILFALILAFADMGSSLVFPDLALLLIFVLPVLGGTLASVSLNALNTVAIGLAACVALVLSVMHVEAFDQSWNDYNMASSELALHMGADDEVLANDRWPVALGLYESGTIDEPDQVIDENTLLAPEVVYDFCSFRWIVNETIVTPWSNAIGVAIGSCGENTELSHSQSTIEGFSSKLGTESRMGMISVMENENPFEDATP